MPRDTVLEMEERRMVAKLDDSNRLLQLLNTMNMVCTESLAAAVVIVHLWEFIADNK